ncbi:hypothetical protein [Salinigranum sp. GCM10025319]|uniref:hypothetical protein n=1 Tax=Salinigranum sp. GCM10025319 TaxID=3252687 RepID=UPI00360C8220
MVKGWPSSSNSYVAGRLDSTARTSESRLAVTNTSGATTTTTPTSAANVTAALASRGASPPGHEFLAERDQEIRDGDGEEDGAEDVHEEHRGRERQRGEQPTENVPTRE